jgi:subtilase family serine protease
VSLWLNPHNKAELDAAAKDLYNPKSPNYRHWLSKSEFLSKYAPTAAEAKTVQDFLTSNNLKIVKVGPDNFYVRARGTVGQVSSAFHVSLNNYQVNGKTVRANASDPVVRGNAASLVASVAGLDNLSYTHPAVTRSTGLPVGKSGSGLAAEAVKPAASEASPKFDSACFTDNKETETFTTSGSLPKATYSGHGYTKSVAGCGYTPANIQEAYNLTPLYTAGYDGKGQTIVIIDWCGSPTITKDANAFSSQFGLPKLTSANFNIIYTPSPSYCEAPDPEINIDVEWAHAIAPGAAIDLVVPPSASFQDTDEAFFYAVDYQLGSVISGSYGSEEYYTSPAVLVTEDLIAETAAVLGISANFSSGDDGDFTFDLPQYYPASVSAPADLPYATGIGGVSLALSEEGKIAWQAGWGTNENLLAETGFVADPPAGNAYFNFGSGGGPSGFFAKPSYQSSLKGPARQVPDISWLADPFTGAYIAISEPAVIPELQYQVYGGTSLACPMFSALWAIANQVAGAPLGQAAPYLYSMPSGTVTDIVPYNPHNHVVGTVTDSKGTTSYTAVQLVDPTEGTQNFASVIWDYPLLEDTAIVLTFGTDSGLKTGIGYDNVTGVGVPNGEAFVLAFKP